MYNICSKSTESLIFISILHYPLKLKADSLITARFLLNSADSLASTIASDSKLLLANAAEIDTTGKATSWNYLYPSITNRKEHYFHTENTSVIYDSLKDMRFGIAPVDSNLIDSDSALNLAELSYGYDFRKSYPEARITALLYKIVYPPFTTYWEIQNIGTDFSITIRIDALTGDVITSVDQNANRAQPPNSFELSQNHPNPFNSLTKIRFKISHNCFVNLMIINLKGQLVRTLIDEERSAGIYEAIWDGRNNFNEQVSSGIYLYQLEANDFSAIYKMTFLK